MLIIHGDHVVASRQYYIDTKSMASTQDTQIVQLPGDTLTLTELHNATQATSLLGKSVSVFVEGFFSRRVSQEKKKIVDYLKAHLDSPIIFWDAKDVSTQLTGLPVKIIKKFDLPKSIWQFLDTLSPSLFQSAVKTTEPELILSLLATRLHQLIMIRDGVAPLGLANWQVGKLKNLSSKFSLEKLISMQAALLDIDYRQKTSTSASSLAASLELWLAKYVQ